MDSEEEREEEMIETEDDSDLDPVSLSGMYSIRCFRYPVSFCRGQVLHVCFSSDATAVHGLLPDRHDPDKVGRAFVKPS